MNYITDVKLSTHIKILALSLAFTGLAAPTASASSLTPEERNVCSTLRFCVDIIRRHSASEFDYEVLESEFQRFGPAGRKALMDILQSKAGNADIARMIARAAPLTPGEKVTLKKNWSLDKAEIYLPFLLNGDPFSRDILLLTLGSENPAVRETARTALRKLSPSIIRRPISQELLQPLSLALAQDPISEAAPYVERLNPKGHEDFFSSLLGSGDTELAMAAYGALYRSNPSQAFTTLLSEMNKFSAPKQSQAIGELLLRRHANRADGFYLKFAGDVSGDQKQSVPARAAGMHAVLSSGQSELSDFTPARAQALMFIVSQQPFVTQNDYLASLKRLKAENELNLIWKIALEEKWINRDRIAAAFEGLSSHDKVVSDLIRADDLRSFSAGAAQAKPAHAPLLRAKLNHPVKAIRDLARKTLKLPAEASGKSTCIISKFDSNDRLSQMPFFKLAWMTADNSARVVLNRKFLSSAHPSETGWLAGYNLQKQDIKSAHFGAALMHFDNKSGGFEQIGRFDGPVAVLPDRLLKLGESTNRFWVIDQWGVDSRDMSAYKVDLTTSRPIVKHLGVLPLTVRDFSVAPNGDLLMRSDDKTQAPLRMSPRGEISLACRSLKPVNVAPAPN